MKNKKPKESFYYAGKNGTYIMTKVLKTAPKGEWKNDIIELSFQTKKEKWERVMTPYEAIIISLSLLFAVLDDNETRRKIR